MYLVFSRFTSYLFKTLPVLILAYIVWGQWMAGMNPFNGGGIANWAHVGGALGGIWYLYITKK